MADQLGVVAAGWVRGATNLVVQLERKFPSICRWDGSGEAGHSPCCATSFTRGE